MRLNKGNLVVHFRMCAVCVQAYPIIQWSGPVHTSPNPTNCPRLVCKKGYRKMDGVRLMEGGLR